MAATQQLFDFDKARALESELTKEIDTINDALNKIKTQRVDTVREWWKGGSEEAFISNFDKTKKDVSKGLQKWLEEYKKLIQDVAKTKKEQDDALKKALNK